MAAPQTNAVSRVYADALLALGQQNNELDDLAQEMVQLDKLIQSNADLARLIGNPIIGATQRTAMVQRLFEGKTSDTLYKFIQVLGRKSRLAALPSICDVFARLVADHRGQVEVQVTVAKTLDDATALRIAKELGESMGKTVTLQQTVDESLIGGMKLRIGDRLIDASVSTRLKNVATRLAAAGRDKARTTLIAD
ncbi:MAG: ATP synthase F1 subunit delta [Algisphaera sp.]